MRTITAGSTCPTAALGAHHPMFNRPMMGLLPSADRRTHLGDAFDRTVQAAMPAVQRLPPWDLSHALLAQPRRRYVEGLVGRLQGEVKLLTPGVLGGEPEAVARYDALVEGAISELRRAHLASFGAPLQAMDRWVYRDGTELSDDPQFPLRERVHVLDTLDRLNQYSGCYKRWIDLIGPLLPQPAKITDLAAGAGGFALALKKELGDAVQVTATDIKPEYLELGRTRAAAAGLDVAFAEQDATNLQPLAGSGVDLFTCTTSLHHFKPGMAARMLGEALRAARVGVCFIDGERGLFPAFLVGSFLALYGRSWPVVHDTLVSFRRMYVAEEMDLLARLAPVGDSVVQVHSGRLPPAHAYVMLTRGRQDS